MREVPKQNYIIVCLMAFAVIVLGFILRNIYMHNHKETYTPMILDTVSVIKYDDLDNYLQENPDAILYINNSNKKVKKSFEKGVKKLIEEKNIAQYIVYIERTPEVVKKYDLKNNNPIFIAYQNGAITEILSKDEYTVGDVESFLIRNKVIENND